MKRHGAAVALYGLAARLLPGAFRARSGAAAEEVFIWQLDRVDGRWRRFVFVIGALADLVRQSIVLRLRRGGSPATVGAAGRRTRVEPFLQTGRIAVRGLIRQPSFTLAGGCDARAGHRHGDGDDRRDARCSAASVTVRRTRAGPRAGIDTRAVRR